MNTLIKTGCFIMLAIGLIGVLSCSNSSTSNNNQSNSTDSTSLNSIETRNLSGGSKQGSNCDRPVNLYLSNSTYNGNKNYDLTYTWNSVANAVSYEFKYLLNGTSSFQNLSVTDTFITFTQTISASDTMHATVKTNCGSGNLSSIKESNHAVYLNAIANDDIIFLMGPTNDLDDICSRTCDKIKFTGNTILNADSTTITITSFAAQLYYLDFNTVKNCIQCGLTGAQVVDTIVFNSCISSPTNEFWIYDPGEYTECQ